MTEPQNLMYKHILVGLTYVDQTGEPYKQVQVHGYISRVSEATICFHPDKEGEFCIPNDPENLTPADPGEYTLRGTGEVVVDPDYLSTWTIVTSPDEIAKTWIEYTLLDDRTKNRGDYREWVLEIFDNASRTDPEYCQDLIMCVLKQDHPDPMVMACLAAGPMEDCLAHFGPEVIGRVVRLSCQDRRFRKLLGGVWKSTIRDDVWEQVEAYRDEPW